MIAFGIWVHEVLFDKHKEEVEALIEDLIVGTVRWYQAQALLFQYGDSLQWIDERYQYPTIDPLAQIVKRAAVIEVGPQVRIKIAKLDVSGLPEPLTAAELAAFVLYINRIKVAGTDIAVISRVADLLKVTADVYYDPLVLDATGQRLDTPGSYPVEDAINGYIQNLPFNGVFSLTELQDEIQKAVGVVDPRLTTVEAKYGATPYVSIDRVYTADAGHMVIDPLFPLNTTLNYIASV